MTAPEATPPTTTITPETAAPNTRQPRRRSIRTAILALALIPPLLISASSLISTLTVQRNHDEQLLTESVTQLTSNFSERILDLQELLALPLTDKQMLLNTTIRAETMLTTSKLPITNIAVIDPQGNVLVGYSSTFKSGDAATDPNLSKKWAKLDPQMTAALKKTAVSVSNNLLQAQQGYTGNMVISGKPTTVTASLIPGSEGVTLVTVDSSYITQRVRENVQRNILITGLMLLLTALLTSMFAQRLINRLTNLTRLMKAAADGDMTVAIPVTGNDEITTMEESADRLVESTKIAVSFMEEQV